MAYAGNTPVSGFRSIATKDTFSGDGSTTAFTLSLSTRTNDVEVFVENVQQEPTTAYTISGTTLTFTSAPVSGTNNIYVVYRGETVSNGVHTPYADLTAGNTTITGDLDVTGNVGIGTSSPLGLIHGYSAAGNAYGYLESGSGAKNALMWFRNADCASLGGYVGLMSTEDLRLWNSESTNIVFGTNNAERMRINSSGNVGIGVTPEVYNTSYDSIDINDHGGVIDGNNYFQLSANAYYATDSSWKYKKTGVAAQNYYQGGGIHAWRYAPSGTADNTITWSEAMRITSGGAVNIGYTGSLASFTVYSQNNAGSSTSYSQFNRTKDAANAFYIRDDGLTMLGGTLSLAPYNRTTATAANMYVATNGTLYRSTSSGRFKTDVEDLDETHTNLIYDLRPVWYRSTTGNDNPDWSWYGLIAEEVGEVDPRLVFWKTHEVSSNPDYNPEDPDSSPDIETPLETPVAEGVMYERLIPHLINVVKTQKAELDAIKARLETLEAEVATLKGASA